MQLWKSVFVSLLIVAMGGSAPGQTSQTVSSPTWGFDLSGMDRSVRPGDDFYRYANGAWLERTAIGLDHSSVGTLEALSEANRNHVQLLLEQASRQPGSRIGAFYKSYMDEATIDARGVSPLKPTLDAVSRASTRAALTSEMARLESIGVGGIFDTYVDTDKENPTKRAVYIRQSGLGMPGRDYYLKVDPKMKSLRNAYEEYLTRLLVLLGKRDAESRAHAVVEFEAKLAAVQWDRVASRDDSLTYNPWVFSEFGKRAPGFDWAIYRQHLHISSGTRFVVAQPSAVTGESQVWNETSLPVLRDWLTLRFVDRYCKYLSQPFVEANFAFYGKTMNGVSELRPRSARGVSLVSDELQDGVGQAFAAQYFSSTSKTAVEEIAQNISLAFSRRLKNEQWMSPETKTKALAKLAAIKIMIGYPPVWRNDAGLLIRPDDLVGNVVRAEAFEHRYRLSTLNKPVQRGEGWGLPVMAAGGEALPDQNVLIIPAGLLQPPVFDAHADAAVNYGAIGIIIGHEFSHFFDDQGRKHDASGRLTDWWTPENAKGFTDLTEKLVKQYDAYEPVPNVHVNGRLTLGENIADLAGLELSHDAYVMSLSGRTAPVLDGYSGDQRFYLGQAQLLREKTREDSLRNQLLNDPHVPGRERVLSDRNLSSWYAAFDVKPEDKLYLSPDKRVQIW
jgi:putative endopeptidase